MILLSVASSESRLYYTMDTGGAFVATRAHCDGEINLHFSFAHCLILPSYLLRTIASLDAAMPTVQLT